MVKEGSGVIGVLWICAWTFYEKNNCCLEFFFSIFSIKWNLTSHLTFETISAFYGCCSGIYFSYLQSLLCHHELTFLIDSTQFNFNCVLNSWPSVRLPHPTFSIRKETWYGISCLSVCHTFLIFQIRGFEILNNDLSYTTKLILIDSLLLEVSTGAIFMYVLL